jgi:2-oxoglutarate/2-oxoacid ferredoxin oxidoreductase subunit alpha
MGEIIIRIAAANGDGVESSGDLVAKTFLRAGLNVFANRSYQSIIRGGHVWYQIRAGNDKLYSPGDCPNVLVALNQDAIENQGPHLAEGAIVIFDGSKVNVNSLSGKKFTPLDIRMLDIVVKNGGDPILRNVVAIGTVMKLAGIDLEIFNKQIRERFGKKGDLIINNNINCALAGYNYAGVSNTFNMKGDGKSRYLIDGNSALAAGAFASGCRFYAAYPMTPATTLLHWFAAHADYGVMCKQTEDEIAAINMAIGAASTGVRAMCGTSGGGFSLMVEALGLSGMLEVPIVAVNAQRGGPSTGLPTKTEQGDLLFVMHASQGDFPRIVVAPRSIEESFTIGTEVFNLAERYQCPVIVLMDLYISESMKSIDSFDADINSIKVDKGKIGVQPPAGTKFKRYEITEDGISPRAFPGMPGFEHIAASDDHDEGGEVITDYYAGIDKYVEVRKKMHSKRMRKLDTMLKQESVFVPNVEADGDYYLVTFGSTTESAKGALKMLKKQGINMGLISFNYLMPLDKEKTKKILSGKKLIDLEYNYSGQLAYVIMANTGIDIKNKILKYDGEAITEEEIALEAAKVVKNNVNW